MAVALCLALLPGAGVAQAGGDADEGPQSRPNGPWVQDSQEMNLDGFRDYNQLTADLKRIERRSQGRMTLESVGKSNEGRDIWLATVGTGDRSVLYVTQQHGNEPHGTEAAVEALQTLSRSNHPEVRRIRDELTVGMVVRANPDGSERYWRQNVDPDCDRNEPSCLPGRGYDPNRWHDPRIDDDEVPVPEALAVRETYERFQPEVVIDYHGQLSYVSDEGRNITTSVLWSQFPDDVEVTPERQHAIDYGKQVSTLVYDSLQRYGHAEVTRYPSGTTMGTARNAYGYLGSASVLLEQRADAGQKSIGMLVRQAYVTMLDIAQAAADGSVFDIDPTRADELPPRGPRITNPNERHHEERCELVDRVGPGDVVDLDGELYDYVLDYADERILPEGSEAYVRPTLEESCTMAAGFERLVDGHPEEAAGLVDQLGYDVVRLHDDATGRSHVLLSERLAAEQVGRGWGLYVHTPGAQAEATTLHSPYPGSATFSERLAAQAFDAAGAENLFVAGAHRRANVADEIDTEPANPTRNADSAFHRVHVAVATGRDHAAIQLLGATGGDREVVVTAGEAPPTSFAQVLGAGFSAHDYDVCLYGDGDCTRLPSTGNVQGQASRASGADWAALYPSFEIRRLLSNRDEFARALADSIEAETR